MSLLGDPTAAADIARQFNKKYPFNSNSYSCYARKPCTVLPEWYQLTQAAVNFLYQNRSDSFTAAEIFESIENVIEDSTEVEVNAILVRGTKQGLFLSNFQNPNDVTNNTRVYSYNPRSAMVNPNNWAFVWNYKVQGQTGGPQPAYIYTNGDPDFILRTMPKGTERDVLGSYTTLCRVREAKVWTETPRYLPAGLTSCSQRDSKSKQQKQTLTTEEEVQGCVANQTKVINNGYVPTPATSSLTSGTWQ